MYLFFVLCVLIFSGGRTPNKRRQHGHRIHNKQGGGGGAASSSAPGEQGKLGSPELQAIDPNVATPPPHRRGPRRHSNGKGFVWKQVGFSECSKTCGGGKYIHIYNHTFTQQLRIYTILAFNIIPLFCDREKTFVITWYLKKNDARMYSTLMNCCCDWQVYNRRWSFASETEIKCPWPITVVRKKIDHLRRLFDVVPNLVQPSEYRLTLYLK